jgi:hypothetical protein
MRFGIHRSIIDYSIKSHNKPLHMDVVRLSSNSLCIPVDAPLPESDRPTARRKEDNIVSETVHLVTVANLAQLNFSYPLDLRHDCNDVPPGEGCPFPTAFELKTRGFLYISSHQRERNSEETLLGFHISVLLVNVSDISKVGLQVLNCPLSFRRSDLVAYNKG